MQDLDSENYERQILSDVCAAKILSILKGKELLPDRAQSVCISHYMPEPATAILQRAKILDTDGYYSQCFVELYKKRGRSLDVRIEYVLKSALDFISHGEHLFQNINEFMFQSQVFSSFDYSKGFGSNIKDRNDTEDWCRYVSSLTELEAPKLVESLQPLGENLYDSVLEFGGNIGTFAEEVCRRLEVKKYSIVDIPLVCDIGEEKVGCGAFANVIRFVKGDMFEYAKNLNEVKMYNTIIFKSVLHDWPIQKVDELLGYMLSALPSGSQLLILERCSFLQENLRSSAFHDVSNLVFSPFYREPCAYEQIIKNKCSDLYVEIKYIWLDMKWFILRVERR